MQPQQPARRENITSKTIGKETFLYDIEKGTVHILNSSAQIIWDLCNGQHTSTDMKHALCSRFEFPTNRNMVNDIENTLEAFYNKGLLH